jgi:hypothetical protein
VVGDSALLRKDLPFLRAYLRHRNISRPGQSLGFAITAALKRRAPSALAVRFTLDGAYRELATQGRNLNFLVRIPTSQPICPRQANETEREQAEIVSEGSPRTVFTVAGIWDKCGIVAQLGQTSNRE